MDIPFLDKFLGKEEKSKITTEAVNLKDIIAPSSISVGSDHIKVGEKTAKSYFVFSYPKYINTGWTSPLINLNHPMDISFFIHPINTAVILKQLRKKLTQIKAEMAERREKGLIEDPSLRSAHEDIKELRNKLQTARERMFRLSIYLTVYGKDEGEIENVENTLRSILESRMIYVKPALYQQEKGFKSTSPYGRDLLDVHTPMNTAPLSSIFPFMSFDLSSNEGILYGVNQHNNSLVLFDRFSLPNANMTIFATSGAGKSYFVKLEVLRYLMTGVDSIIIDPENEYKFLADAVGGSFLNISLSSSQHINPFDLPMPREDEDPKDVLRSNIINLVGLFRIMLGGLSPEEDSIIDRALTETYAAKDITPETDPELWNERVPLLEDFETVLEGMVGTESLLKRLRKYTQGSYAEFFNNYTNISTDKHLVVFGIRDMEDELRPMAMFIIMRYIWNKVRSELKKRILVVDEAWWIMQNEDGASFLFGMVKRGRKYWLGVSTITQDVGDFMQSEYGKPIITNSSLQLLLKQSPATIDQVQKAFNLTENEINRLLEAEVGEGLFFAGKKHVAIKVEASYTEDQIITTSPEEIQKIKREKG